MEADPDADAALVQGPPEFTCHITHEVMRDPVSTADGHTYDRRGIEGWFAAGGKTSPATGLPLPHQGLVPNFALRTAIAGAGFPVDPLGSSASAPSAPASVPAPTPSQFAPFNFAGPHSTSAPATPGPFAYIDALNADLVSTIQYATAPAAAPAPAPISTCPLVDLWDEMAANPAEFPRPEVPPTLGAGTVSRQRLCLGEERTEFVRTQQLGGSPQPLLLVAVADVSGSMNSAAATKGDGAQVRRLELVQHALNTAALMLGAGDALAVVAFSNAARVALAPTEMGTRLGVALAEASIRGLKPGGGTNLWAGIQAGVRLCAHTPPDGRRRVVLVLTDGEPESSPPKGEIWETRQLLESLTDTQRPLLATAAFGMGAGLNSGLMSGLARLGGYHYAYVSDGSMVGNVFIRLVAHALCTGAARLQADEPLVEADTAADAPLTQASAADIAYERARAMFLRALGEACDEMRMKGESGRGEALKIINTAHAAFVGSGEPRVLRLRDDLQHPDSDKGQIRKAVEDWDAWGRHYLPSAYSAHRLRLCGNFKDASQQDYGGPWFKATVALGDAIFAKLTPPWSWPGREPLEHHGLGGLGGGPPATPLPMSAALNNPAGSCFTGDTVVAVPGGRARVDMLRIGDVVETEGGAFAVRCVVTFEAAEQDIARGDGFGLTPWHPIKLEGKWVFPAQAPALTQIRENCPLYNFVLAGGHTLLLGAARVPACTLGHGFDGPVVGHDFFGTQAVVQDLARREGWARGRVVFPPATKAVRWNGRVVGWATPA
jgi:Mg-chelatase subunit ChlD